MKWTRKDEKKKKIERKEDRKKYRKIENERKKDDSNDERKAEGRKLKERKEVNRDIIHIQNLTNRVSQNYCPISSFDLLQRIR